RLAVRQRLLAHVDARLSRPLLGHVPRGVEHALRQTLLPLAHQVVDELGDRLAVVARVGRHRAAHRLLAPTHAPPSFCRFAPYLERDFLRSFTPAASSVPSMMW